MTKIPLESLKTKLKISDPKGTIWGVTVQDEQGKLNARTCNVNALQTLSRLVDSRVINLKDYLTLYSGRDATWISPSRPRTAAAQCVGPCTSSPLRSAMPPSRSFSSALIPILPASWVPARRRSG